MCFHVTQVKQETIWPAVCPKPLHVPQTLHYSLFRKQREGETDDIQRKLQRKKMQTEREIERNTYYQSVPPPSFIFPVSGQLRRSNSSSFSSQRCVQGRSKPGKWATHQAFCHQTPFTCLPTPRSRTQLGHSFSQKYIRWSGAAPLHAFAPHSFCIYAAFVVLLEEAKTGTR